MNASSPEAIEWGRIVLCALLVAFGLIVHFVSKLSDLEANGKAPGVAEFLAVHKWSTLNVVLGAYGLLLLSFYTREMGPVGSFCMGVAADVAGARLRARAQAKLDSQPNVPPGA